MHFGRCEPFAFVNIDQAEEKILGRQDVEAPPHRQGLLPGRLAERGVNTVIGGGMGQRAQGLFGEQGIEVVIGAPADTPEALLGHDPAGTLEAGGIAATPEKR